MWGFFLKFSGFLILMDQFNWTNGGYTETYRRMWDVLCILMAALGQYFWVLVNTQVYINIHNFSTY